MRIGTREIGPGHSPWVVAEISGEHRGDRARLMALLNAAKDAGADAVKVQCFDPDKLAASRGGADKRLTSGPWAGMTLGEIYKATHTSRPLIESVMLWCEHNDFTWFASAFSSEDVDFLEARKCPAYKIASFELTNLPLIRKAASTGKPVILSTGMADEDSIQAAVDVFDADPYPPMATVPASIGRNCALLHCVSAYPCPPEEANLERINALFHLTGLDVVGFSDHTLGPECAIAAVALGASIIEKHITLDRNDGGLDASFSMEPKEFAEMVSAIRNVHAALQPPKGDGEAIYRELRSRA